MAARRLPDKKKTKYNAVFSSELHIAMVFLEKVYVDYNYSFSTPKESVVKKRKTMKAFCGTYLKKCLSVLKTFRGLSLKK